MNNLYNYNVTDFKERLTALLKARDTGDYSCAALHYPVCVMYFGASSAVYHESISKKLINGWGSCADQIPYYVLEREGLKNLNGESIDAQSFGRDMTNLLKNPNMYTDPSGICLYCVLDTDSADDDNSEDFDKWYFAIDNIKKMINTPLMTMLFIVLNDEFSHQKKSVEIKQRLCEIYKSQNHTHSYSSVFVLGRRQRNGAYANDSLGDLLGYIILLSDTAAVDSDRRANLYKADRPALTAAYASSAKPVGDIAVITLKAITAKLSQMLNDESVCEKIGESHIAKILEVNKGQSELYERIYEKISRSFPANDRLRLLPGKPDLSGSFADADQASYGCLSAFLKKNHLSVIDDKMNELRPQIISRLTDKICEELTAGQLSDGIDGDVISAVLDKARVAGDTDALDRINVFDAVKIKLKSAVADIMQDIIRETFAKVLQQSKFCTDCFYSIKKSADMMPSARETGTGLHLVKFYTALAGRHLNHETSVKIFNRIFKISNKESDITDALFAGMESCFASDKVYRYSYIDEMYERLGINDIHTATNQIIGELIESLDEKVRFYSATVFPNNRTFEAYFLSNATLESADGNGLYDRLKNRELPPNTQRTFFNTCNNDIIETMWFYECRENDLTAEF